MDALLRNERETRPLTDRQREILLWIETFISTQGHSPSIREIVKAFGYRSNAAAAGHLIALRKKGKITWRPGFSRTISIVRTK